MLKLLTYLNSIYTSAFLWLLTHTLALGLHIDSLQDLLRLSSKNVDNSEQPIFNKMRHLDAVNIPFQRDDGLIKRTDASSGPDRTNQGSWSSVGEFMSFIEPVQSSDAQYIAKRATNSDPIPIDGNKTKKPSVLNSKDMALKRLKYDPRCSRMLRLCDQFPSTRMQCLIHCQLNNQVLKSNSTKFLFTLSNLFRSFPQSLCPSLASIYNDIHSNDLVVNPNRPRTLATFLDSVGFGKPNDAYGDFVKNSPATIIPVLAKFTNGPEMDTVRYIIDDVEQSLAQINGESQQFPSLYGSSTCKMDSKSTAYMTIIDTMTTNPSVTDLFLKGYWTMTRLLTTKPLSPVDAYMTSLVQAIQLLAGVSCSLVAYAENGKPFKCKQPPPLQTVLDEYREDTVLKREENAFDYIVCGAHQLEMPKWVAKMQGLDVDGDSNKTSTNANYEDLDVFPNPEEFYPYLSSKNKTL